MMRGEIWWAEFGVPFGSEPGFRRPVLIVQDDSFNKSRINTTIVIPLTTNLVLGNAPGNVLLDKEDSNLTKDSVIVVTQVGVIDKNRLVERVKRISSTIMDDVDYGIKLVLDIK